jgi:hypothetical protein
MAPASIGNSRLWSSELSGPERRLTEFRFHDLRHTARLGAIEQQLKALGGWKSAVVSHYVHLVAEDAEEVPRCMNESGLEASQSTK